MNKRTKVVVAAGSLALVLAGTGAGVAAAQGNTPSSPESATTAPADTTHHNHKNAAGTDATGTDTTGAGHHKGAHAKGAHPKGAAGAGHAEFTKHTKTGDKVLDAQRGVVTAIDATSMTVTSTDGFVATYTLDAATKIHKDKKAATLSQIAPQDHVRVLAEKVGTTVTALRVGDAGPGK